MSHVPEERLRRLAALPPLADATLEAELAALEAMRPGGLDAAAQAAARERLERLAARLEPLAAAQRRALAACRCAQVPRREEAVSTAAEQRSLSAPVLELKRERAGPTVELPPERPIWPRRPMFRCRACGTPYLAWSEYQFLVPYPEDTDIVVRLAVGEVLDHLRAGVDMAYLRQEVGELRLAITLAGG